MRSGPDSSTKMTVMPPRLVSCGKDADVNSDISDLIPTDRSKTKEMGNDPADAGYNKTPWKHEKEMGIGENSSITSGTEKRTKLNTGNSHLV